MRRLYKLLTWDYETNEGTATDGTKWEGNPILFHVRGSDLSPEYNGFLNIEEVFSAEENNAHYLFEVLVERGPRAPVQPSKPQERLNSDAVENIVEASRRVDEQVDQFDVSVYSQSSTLTIPKQTFRYKPTREPVSLEALSGRIEAIWDSLTDINRRLRGLENRLNGTADDGR